MARRRHDDDWFRQISSELLDRFTERHFRLSIDPSLGVRRFWEPRVDVCETPDGLAIKAEAAGVEPESFHISLSPDLVSVVIRGTRLEAETESQPRVRCLQLEIYYGDFERAIPLPKGVWDRDNVKATYKAGFLYITIPRLAEEDGPLGTRNIPITD